MPDPLVPQRQSDRNLLFGILAWQMDFISRDALVQALSAWDLDKHKPLGQILLEQGHLNDHRLHLLQEIVAEHLRAHNDDPQQSLAAVNALGSARRFLEMIAHAGAQASLDSVSSAADTDSGATGPYQPPPKSHEPAEVQADTLGVTMRYRVLRPHAKGGLGQVFVAEDTELDRQVALKEIREHHAHDPQSRSRFLLEAKITGGLEHPGIVPVYSRGSMRTAGPITPCASSREIPSRKPSTASIKRTFRAVSRENEVSPCGNY
jgi:hypothetical protein